MYLRGTFVCRLLWSTVMHTLRNNWKYWRISVNTEAVLEHNLRCLILRNDISTIDSYYEFMVLVSYCAQQTESSGAYLNRAGPADSSISLTNSL